MIDAIKISEAGKDKQRECAEDATIAVEVDGPASLAGRVHYPF